MDTKQLRVSVSVFLVEKKKLLAVMASAVPPLTVFHLVNLWTLLNAFSITVAFAYALVQKLIFNPYTAVGQPVTTADADDHHRRTAILLCSTLQAVAGTQALLLPCHWRRLRRASAYAGLALTVAGNCIVASAVRAILVDDQGNLFFRIVGTAVAFGSAVFDLLAFVALGRGDGEEQEAELINLADLFT